MSETKNYNDSVIIPFLQRKVQELFNQNLVLEANILVERQKLADAQKELTIIQKDIRNLLRQQNISWLWDCD